MNGLTSFKTTAQTLNDLTYNDWFFRLMSLARIVYKWENLPDGIDERWIEKYLFNDGKCVFYKDELLGFIVSKCNQQGKLNPYDEPTHVRTHGTGLQSRVLEVDEECVIIGNNSEFVPTNRSASLTAYKLTNIDRAIDINVNAQKTPTLILCDEKQRKTMLEIYKKWDGNEPVIFGDKSLENNPITVAKTDAPIVFKELELQKHMVLNSFLTLIGINNANQDKRERLVNDEVQANNQHVEMSGNIFLASRQEAVRKINKMFNLDIKVSVRVDIDMSIIGHHEEKKEVQENV